MITGPGRKCLSEEDRGQRTGRAAPVLCKRAAQPRAACPL
jgi:hypothetical protein